MHFGYLSQKFKTPPICRGTVTDGGRRCEWVTDRLHASDDGTAILITIMNR
jgi:hypothetical protein